MSLPIAGIGAVQPAYAPAPVAPYAQNQTVAESVAGTISGAETGAVSVVYEPSASDTDAQLTYSSRETNSHAAAVAAKPVTTGDDAVVKATGGTSLPPPKLPDTPLSAEVHDAIHNVWAPVHPVNLDPAAAAAPVGAPVQVGQAEAAAQATYAAIVDATITGAPIEKYA